ncbi:MAG: DUF1653 domain-containing protein [Pseudomonadota bacterium]
MDPTPADRLDPHRALAGSVWRHRKGGLYRIECIALKEADLSLEVVYRARRGGAVYTRPFQDFMDGRFRRLRLGLLGWWLGRRS